MKPSPSDMLNSRAALQQAHVRDYAVLAEGFRELAPASVLRYLEKVGYQVSDELLARVLETQREGARV